MLVGDCLKSLEHCPVSFTLPGLRPGWRRATAFCAVGFGLLGAFQTAWMAWSALVFGCLSAFWFALGLLLFDPGLPRVVTRSALVLAIVSFLALDWIWVLLAVPAAEHAGDAAPPAGHTPMLELTSVARWPFAALAVVGDDRRDPPSFQCLGSACSRAAPELGAADGHAAALAHRDMLAARDGARRGRTTQLAGLEHVEPVPVIAALGFRPRQSITSLTG